jgi:hypothetical protein
MTNVGFSSADAVATLNVSAFNFSRLFYIKTHDVENRNNMSYGVIGTPELNVTTGVNPFQHISYSQSNIYAGFANPALSFVGNSSLYQDYIRYTSNAITGGYALTDVFSNKFELLEGVGNMDAQFKASLADRLNNASNCETSNINPTISSYPFVLSCKTLVDNLLNDAVNSNSPSYVRGQKFLSDLKAQSNAYNTYWVIFHPGDVMVIRLTYNPQNGSGNPAKNGDNYMGGNPLYDRSYKIYLRMT